MPTADHVSVFARAGEERLVSVERLVLAYPQLLGDAFRECDLAYDPDSRFLGVLLRLSEAAFTAARRDRLAFWAARLGGRVLPVASLDPGEQAGLRAHFGRCEVVRHGIAPSTLSDASGAFFTEAGAPSGRRRSAGAPPLLAMDVGGRGWEGVRWLPRPGVLFVAAPIGPPSGDVISLVLRLPGTPQPLLATATVVEVTPPASATPGQPAGYALRLESAPPEVTAALAVHGGGGQGDEARAAPRFHVNAPVRIITPPTTAGPSPSRTVAPVARIAPVAVAAPRATIEYATEQELAADFVENLSQGGAFVRSVRPPPLGTPVTLELKLPNGAELRARAVVASVNDLGMGVKFALDAEADAILTAAIARISARPRRALVVDDDGLVRRMLTDALTARGFEVLTAQDGAEGLRTLAEELLALDLLVTDVRMPGMNGEELVRTIRTAGGEADLAIVAVSARLEPGAEQQLERAGADAVLDKALGPELIAEAADAVLERKRMMAGAG
jgi:CheY-like chemotaxis protein